MPANDRPLHHEHAPTARYRRRRLLIHGLAFAGAALLVSTLASSTTSAAPTVQDGRYLEGGSVTQEYSCLGADDTTSALLEQFGLSPFPMDVTVTSAAVEPAPSPGEDFTTEFTWDFTLDPGIVSFAIGLGVTDFTISAGNNTLIATEGATGNSPGTGAAPSTVILGDGSIPVGYTAGPYTGSFNRTAAVDDPIVFRPGVISSTVTTNAGTALLIQCSGSSATITVNDATGVAPSTTTTTRVTATVPPTTVTTVAVVDAGAQPDTLPRTGASSTLYLALLGLALIDVGYLALTASKSPQRRTSSAR